MKTWNKGGKKGKRRAMPLNSGISIMKYESVCTRGERTEGREGGTDRLGMGEKPYDEGELLCYLY